MITSNSVSVANLSECAYYINLKLRFIDKVVQGIGFYNKLENKIKWFDVFIKALETINKRFNYTFNDVMLRVIDKKREIVEKNKETEGGGHIVYI